MPSLTKKTIRGRPYYYLRECQRVDGKPKIIWQQYLGSPAELVQRLQRGAHRAVIREFGASAACLQIARQLELVALIDRIVPKRSGQGVSVGQYLLIAALNRCIAPRSKTQLSGWYEQTVLPRLLGVRAAQLTSQRFWDNMSRLDSQAIARIEAALVRAAVTEFSLDLRCLLFDATNFFTFVDSFNRRATLPQRGHSKEGRANLRIVGLALAVTADGEVPLFHHSYAGNQHDSTTFGEVLEDLTGRCRALAPGTSDVTLVFDKGNNSEDNLKSVARSGLHFVGSLVPTQHLKLLAIRRDQMRRLDQTQLPAVWSCRTEQKILGVSRTVLITFNRPLFTAQVKTLRREIAKRRRKLKAVQDALKRSAQRTQGQKPTMAGTQKRVAAILSGRHMKELFSASVKAAKGGRLSLRWRFKVKAWKTLQTTLLGKTILFTDRADWSDEQIVRSYRSQSHVEAAFRNMKDPHYLTFRPTYHWTDPMLRVHALYCVIALMITSLLRRQLAQAGIPLSLARMLEQLSGIREVSLLYQEADANSPRAQTILSDLDEEQQKILAALNLTPLRAA
ncbi:MAG: IS1634 family transposase [Gammaproteobacteria bacterium]|nr:MAG: IS1634 family transposase [Gammaproteobacteria bacterium]